MGFPVQFLVDKPKDVDEVDILLQSKDTIPGMLIRTARAVDDLKTTYLSASKTPRFSEKMFEGLRSLGDVPVFRATSRSQRIEIREHYLFLVMRALFLRDVKSPVTDKIRCNFLFDIHGKSSRISEV